MQNAEYASDALGFYFCILHSAFSIPSPLSRSAPACVINTGSVSSIDRRMSVNTPKHKMPPKRNVMRRQRKPEKTKLRKPPLREAQIFAWAKAHFERTGTWPTVGSGPVIDADEESWKAIHESLYRGNRGLPGGSSLSRFLTARGVKAPKPALTEDQIVEWAKARSQRIGQWPSLLSGAIPEAEGENWNAVDQALKHGFRGLPGGSSVSKLLLARRGIVRPSRRPPLTIPQILDWAEAFFQAHGRWPNSLSGPISGAPGDTWVNVDRALRLGQRGLPGGFSLARLLLVERGAPVYNNRPPLSVSRILEWADEYFRQNGIWPQAASGPAGPGEDDTWIIVDIALRNGARGLAGKSSLARLLKRWRGVRPRRPALCESQIFEWATAHFQRTGSWPAKESGAVHDAERESWAAIDNALKKGSRGLLRGSSLSKLLTARRVERPVRHLRPLLSEDEILSWAQEHFRRTGLWPVKTSGAIVAADGETWLGIDAALRRGNRGLPGGSSLPLFLKNRGIMRRPPLRKSRLTVDQVLAWADAYHKTHGAWPRPCAGPLADAPDETWKLINNVLVYGNRGLPKSSLFALLQEHRGIFPGKNGFPKTALHLKPITLEQIKTWAKTYYQRAGDWPNTNSGPIPGADDLNWGIVDAALRHGKRGLPASSSLAKLFGRKQPRDEG